MLIDKGKQFLRAVEIYPAIGMVILIKMRLSRLIDICLKKQPSVWSKVFSLGPELWNILPLALRQLHQKYCSEQN